MANIYDPYPDRVEVDGNVYLLDLAYDNVLKAIDICNDDFLTRSDRTEAFWCIRYWLASAAQITS